MSVFDIAIQKVLQNEGGFVNNPHDSGGATKFGISLRFIIENFDELPIKIQTTFKAFPNHLEFIMSLSEENAKEIYKKCFWEKYQYSRINHQSIANRIFDMSINMGALSAHKIAQKTSFAILCLEEALVVDGILGEASFQYLNLINVDILLPLLIQGSAAYYEEIAYKNPKLRVFLTGWLSRAYKK